MMHEFVAGMLPHMPKSLVWIFSKRYIAGESIEDGLKISRDLNSEKVLVTIDLLGEFIKDLSEAEENKNNYLKIIDRFMLEGIQGNFSVKPTFFGLLIDKEACYKNVREVVAKAAANKSFVRIDMEDSQCVDMEWELYFRLKEEFPNHVGLVLQAYMRRTLPDLMKLNDNASLKAPHNFRLCKGIYVEPETVAYKEYHEIRQHYLEDLEYMLTHGIYVGIATHDKYLVEKAFDLLKKYNVPKDKYEFQMLLGVTPDLRKRIVAAGHKMRVYVPYGKDWFGYCTRRLKENPKMVNDIVKALFVRG
ncbi:MAG: proline dehydrogenase family protein [Bacteroidota bacterium]|nr:proline dehydrogenase family protein [Bacteroidota bacterium]